MSKTELLIWWATVVSAVAVLAAKYGELSKRKRRKVLLGLIVFLLIFVIPVVLLYLAPDDWFAMIPRYYVLPAVSGPPVTLSTRSWRFARSVTTLMRSQHSIPTGRCLEGSVR